MNILEKWENRFLFVPKILQMVVCLQYYTLHNLRHLFATDFFKISIAQYGEFNAYIQCVTFFSNIYVGLLADRYGKHKQFLVSLLFATCGIFSVFFLNGMVKFGAFMFWTVLYVYQTFNLQKQPLLDTIIFDYLAERPDCTPEVYGRQRMWGTVAYTMATFIVENMVTSHQAGKPVYNWNNLLIYSLVFTGISTLSLIFLVKSSGKVKAHKSTTGYLTLMKNKDYAFFIFIMFMNAVTRQAMSNYLGNFQARVLQIRPYSLPNAWPGWLKPLVGLFNNNYISTISIFGTFFEIMAMCFSERIIYYLGYFKPLLLAQLMSLIRFYAYYSMDKNGKHVFAFSCLVELIKGIYFGLAHISGFVIAARLAPPYLAATSQMIFQGVFNALGSIVSGKAFSYAFGSNLKKSGDSASKEEIAAFELLFLVNIAISMCTILIFVIKYGVIDGVLTNRAKEQEKLTYNEADWETPEENTRHLIDQNA
ncbi:MFS transporter protein [Enterospora canceri]|uniref:MFS transporter protein n=1 Tax=Enterospora canceri TaxID=1081671 RepID=A0A1Y1S6M1_9MICR|nr:MFS transporter protein [Enterospora canceri]